MLSSFMSLWLVAVVGQSPAEDAWLKSVPADTPVVVHFRAMDSVSADLGAMLRAMSPTVANMGLEGQLQVVKQVFGESVGKSPFLVLVGLPDPMQPAMPPWSVIVKADYAATIKGLAAEGEAPKSLAGYESFPSKSGDTWYAAKGAGWVAFGPSEEMIKSIRKPSASFAQKATADLKAKLFAGDVGVYVNIVKVQQQYGDAIEQFTPALLAQMQQANPDPKSAENAETAINAFKEILKGGEGFVLNLDFDAAALTLSGLATVKADSAAAKELAKSKNSSGELMDRLPGNLMMFVSADFSNRSPDASMNALKRAGMPAEKTSPEVTKAKAVAARMKALEGRQVTGMSLVPMRAISLADPSDPKAAVEASLDANKARQALNEGMVVTPRRRSGFGTLTYGGFTLDRAETKIDPKMIDQIKAARPEAPNVNEIMKLMMPSSAITEYTGTDGKLFVTTAASTDEELKAQIDGINDRSKNLGSLAAWKSLRGKLPKQATALIIVNAQEMTNMVLKLVSATDNVERKPVAYLPKDTALLGLSLVNSAMGYDFKLIVPSEVGPAVEKGLAPAAGGQ